MKLNVWNQTDFTNGKEWSITESGIIESHRFIYLFFDSGDIINHKEGIINPPGTKIIGKAIQINLSISKGGSDNLDLAPFVRGSNNSTYMSVSMYVYDTLFDRSITNIRDAQFTLVNSMASSTTNDYDLKKAMTNGVNLYEKDLRDKPEIKDIISFATSSCAPSIPEPMYYTMKQQELDLDEIYCLTALDTTVVHTGNDLVDENTRISVMDTSLMDTLEPRLKAKLYEVRGMNLNPASGVNMYDQTELSNWLMYQDFESMQNGYTYIYDTNMGFNIIRTGKAFLPFAKYQFEDKMLSDIERTKDTIIRHAKTVEKQFGPVRMVFTPLYFGDKTDTYFKDFNPDHQPVIKEKINIDNESKIKTEISTLVNDYEKQQQATEYYEEDIGGYVDGL